MVRPALFGSVITASFGTSTQIVSGSWPPSAPAPIVAILALPISVLDGVTIGKRAAEKPCRLPNAQSSRAAANSCSAHPNRALPPAMPRRLESSLKTPQAIISRVGATFVRPSATFV
jgi:hypothetical protein